MTTHLSHALPWYSLNEALVVDHVPDRRGGDRLLLRKTDNDKGRTSTSWNKIQHFARCLASQLDEFRRTDKWKDVEATIAAEKKITHQ